MATDPTEQPAMGDPAAEAIELAAAQWLVQQDRALEAAQQREFERWLAADPRHAAAFATLQTLNLTVGRAWAIKEVFRALWTDRQGAAVTRFFSRWYAWAIRSQLDP